MPEDIRHTLTQPGASYTLSPSEREEMKREFLSYMSYHAPKAPVAPARPTSHLRRYALAVPALLVGVLIYVSEGALPTEPLYVVKRSVNERAMLSVTAGNPHLTAWANSQIVKRRLAETEELIRNDALVPQIAAALADDIETHTEAVDTYLSKTTDIHDAVRAHATARDLESAFEAHARIIRARTMTNPDTNTLLAEITQHEHEIDVSGEALENIIVTNPDTDELADELRESVRASLADSESALEESLPDILESKGAAHVEEIQELHTTAEQLYASSSEATTTALEISTLYEALEYTDQVETLLDTEFWK